MRGRTSIRCAPLRPHAVSMSADVLVGQKRPRLLTAEDMPKAPLHFEPAF